jgi:hypothetical protein
MVSLRVSLATMNFVFGTLFCRVAEVVFVRSLHVCLIF